MAISPQYMFSDQPLSMSEGSVRKSDTARHRWRSQENIAEYHRPADIRFPRRQWLLWPHV